VSDSPAGVRIPVDSIILATHLFEERGTLEEVVRLATDKTRLSATEVRVHGLVGEVRESLGTPPGAPIERVSLAPLLAEAVRRLHGSSP
jgi:hypothetical protein